MDTTCPECLDLDRGGDANDCTAWDTPPADIPDAGSGPDATDLPADGNGGCGCRAVDDGGPVGLAALGLLVAAGSARRTRRARQRRGTDPASRR